ncbi:hypothetical protein PMAYCL1PPCAC_22959 [Pristionchus mayeri]|uniref:Doublecortin domain-containing protein n=1 Tax=Pristionchus mayeri TaxID=1317129 RepID=A0AAN5CZ41_9BILA|nr:hypothetical protein PMAYCL1PPCAC_22959 [Pristionchus mayeri]
MMYSMSGFRPMALPNVPDPVNGMIRTYDNNRRTYSRPFSAKTVFFYKDGDEHFTGVRLPVSKNRYRTIDSLLDDLNSTLYLPYGVRRLTTPMGRTNIEDLEQLQHMGKYVATSSKFPRGINLSALERFAKARQAAHAKLSRETEGGQSYWVPTSPSYKTKLRMTRSLGLNYVPSKQIFFVLNGTSKMYRTLLNPSKMPPMDKILSDVSEGLGIAIHRIFTFDGKRVYHGNELIAIEPPKVLAVPRHSKPIIQEQRRFLPPINSGRQGTFTKRVSGKTTTTTRTTLTSLTASTSSQKSDPENLVEKPRSSIRKNLRRTTGAPKKKKIEPVRVGRKLVGAAAAAVGGAAAGGVVLPKMTQQRRSGDETDSGKATSAASSRDKGPPIEEDEDSSDYPDRRDDVTLTPDSRNAALIREEHEERHHQKVHQERREEDLILDDDDDIDQNRRGTAHTELESRQSSSEEDQPDTEEEFADGEEEHAPNGVDHQGQHEEEDNEREEEDDDHQVHEEDQQRHGSAHHKAATVIQAHVRGHLVRKKIGDSNESEEESEQSSSEEEQPDTDDEETGITAIPEEEEEEAKEPNNNEENDDTYEISHTPRPINAPPIPPPPGTASSDEEVEYGSAHYRAATVIQKHVRGHLTRKAIGFKRHPYALADKNEGHMPNTPPPEEPHTDAPDLEIIERDDSPNHSTQSEPIMTESGQMTYSITVHTGNRWGADSEVDLFMTIIGDVRMSEKIVLVDNEMRTPKHRQNQLDTFHTTQAHLGTLQKIIVGHDVKGYGAGIFIDHILITENNVDGRQFVFYINKWFDSGQVDGKLVRTIPLSALYFISSIHSAMQMQSQGRWEFVLHNGFPNGEGGTTSNLRFYGFGSSGVSITTVGNDTSLQRVPSASLIQVDFGNIGELLKVRIEIDGEGASPDYYLEYVEMLDLDTEEKLCVRVANWLDFTGTRTKKPQRFRELALFRSGSGKFLQNYHYEGRVSIGDTSLLSSRMMEAQLVGDLSDSGVFPLVAGKDEKKGDYTFKVECVDLGRIQYLKIYPDFTETGREIFDGLSLLQGIWEKHGLGDIPVGEGLIANSSWVRQSTHDPYRFVLNQSHVHDWEFDEEENEEEEGEKQREKKERRKKGVRRQYKRMASNSIKSLLTRKKKDEEEPVVEDDWLLSMHLEGSPSPPRVTLVAESKDYDMDVVETTDEDPPGILHFGLRHAPSVGLVDKLRVWCTNDEGDVTPLHIKKMRLVNRANNEQLHYPAATAAPSLDAVIEFPAVYPDMAPRTSLTYTVALETVDVSVDPFIAYLKVSGSDSNTGFRPLNGVKWKEGERFEVAFEAVDVGTPSSIELRLEPIEKDAALIRWSGNAMVAASDSEQQYTIDGEMTISSPSVAVKKKLRPY